MRALGTMLTLVEEPEVEPVSLADAKTHLRVDGTDDDTLIETLIAAARLHVEQATNRALVSQTWEMRLDRFPSCSAVAIELPRPPLQSVAQFAYVGPAGAELSLTVADYFVSAPVGPAPTPGTIQPGYGQTWPADARDQKHAVRIRFVAGYGDAAAVPAPLKAALLLVLGDLYQNREAQIVGTSVSDNATVKRLVDPFRVVYV
jgi:uncharacterized phiE125 gp8 family phage protein